MALRSSTFSDTFRPEHTDASLFERFPGLYAFFRERLFRDDTERIIASLWPKGAPRAGATLIELGCGPGFYARRMSRRFPQLTAVGIDRSVPQLQLATERAMDQRLLNCRFEWGDAQAIDRAGDSVDAVIAARLITVLPDPERAVAEIHRVLRPDGHCFIAEPRPHPIARLPLNVMWAAAGAARVVQRHAIYYREPEAPTLLKHHEFVALISSQPWAERRIWVDGRYQYAVCRKA
jgi:arsenite methyltransferase